MDKEMRMVLVKKEYEKIVSELPRILPVGYLIMVLIGMLFNYFKFDYFGINIFQYASVFDFLISPFEDPHILLFIFGSLLVVVFTLVMDKLWERRFPKSYKRWTLSWMNKGWYKPLSFVLVLIVYIFYGAYIYGAYTYGSIHRQKDVVVRFQDADTLHGKQIGKVGNTLFLLCENEVKVIPFTAFRELSFRLEE